jgi:hypothetical protein
MATRFAPADPGFAARVRDSFARQRVMRLIGARLVRIEPGLCAIELPGRICELEVVARQGGAAKACAVGLQTMMCLHDRAVLSAGMRRSPRQRRSSSRTRRAE